MLVTSPTTNMRDYVEKMVKIKQKPNNTSGFGFTVKGGKEFSMPVVVDRVTIGSAADVCELRAGDELIAVNGAEVTGHYQESVMHVVNNAVKVGQLELKIKRFASDEDEEDIDEDDFAEEMRREQQAKRDQMCVSPESVESMNSEEEMLEARIMEDLEAEARLEEETSYKQQPESGDEDEAPPELPSAPPPVPNWNTFPSSTAPVTDLSFLDNSDILPDQQASPANDNAVKVEDDAFGGEEDEVMRLRLERLRRRSEYLGIAMEEMEEYKKLQEERESEKRKEKEAARKQEENVWNRIEKRESMFSSDSSVMSSKTDSTTQNLWQQIEHTSPSKDSNKSITSPSKYDLEQQEREIIENLEREEAERIREKQNARDKLKTQSISMDTKTMETRVERDFQSTVILQKEPPVMHSSRRFVDLDAERKRMEEWDREQERLRQPGDKTTTVELNINLGQERFAKQQEEMQSKFKEEMVKVQEIEARKREQEQKLLEKELAKARELEAKAKAEEEERERKRKQEEEERAIKEEAEKKAETLRRKMAWREEEKRRKEAEEELWKKLDRRAAEIETGKPAEIRVTAGPGAWNATSTVDEKDHWNMVEKTITPEREVLIAHETEALRQEQERLRQLEAERRAREEREKLQLEEREEKIKLMEERIRREAEELRLERERLVKEKEERQQLWEMERNTDRITGTVQTMHSPTAHDFSKPLIVDVDRETADDEEGDINPFAASAPRIGYGIQRLDAVPRGGSQEKSDDRVHAQFQVDILSSDPNNRVSVERASVERYEQHISEEIRQPTKVAPPVSQRSRAPPPVPPKYVTNVTPKQMSRDQVMELTKRPSAQSMYPASRQEQSVYLNRAPNYGSGSQEDGRGDYNHYSVHARMGSDSAASWHSQGSDHNSPNYSPDQMSPSARKGTGASPTKGARHSDIMRQQIHHPNQHWLVEEAERRRVAERTGQERPQTMPQKPSPEDRYYSRGHGDSPTSQSPSGGYAYRPSPTHVMGEHVDRPSDKRANHPIPDSIKHTLIQRVTSPSKSPHSPSHQSPPSPAYSSGYSPHHTSSQHYSPQQSPGSYGEEQYRYPHNVPYIGSGPSSGYSHGPGYHNSDRAPAKPPRSLPVSSSDPAPRAEQIVSVSGKQKCAHCEVELGQGPAMILESLGLYYHMQCFFCCVCHVPLGSGKMGADVRVRGNKLHCHNCYSNDEVGLKFSRV